MFPVSDCDLLTQCYNNMLHGSFTCSPLKIRLGGGGGTEPILLTHTVNFTVNVPLTDMT